MSGWDCLNLGAYFRSLLSSTMTSADARAQRLEQDMNATIAAGKVVVARLLPHKAAMEAAFCQARASRDEGAIRDAASSLADVNLRIEDAREEVRSTQDWLDALNATRAAERKALTMAGVETYLRDVIGPHPEHTAAKMETRRKNLSVMHGTLSDMVSSATAPTSQRATREVARLLALEEEAALPTAAPHKAQLGVVAAAYAAYH